LPPCSSLGPLPGGIAVLVFFFLGKNFLFFNKNYLQKKKSAALLPHRFTSVAAGLAATTKQVQL
jgi:hypothetical protein